MKADTITVGAVKLLQEADDSGTWIFNKFVCDHSAARAASVVNICPFVHRVWLFFASAVFLSRAAAFFSGSSERKETNPTIKWTYGTLGLIQWRRDELYQSSCAGSYC